MMNLMLRDSDKHINVISNKSKGYNIISNKSKGLVVTSTASEMAMPSDPGEVGSFSSMARPDAVSGEGLG
jgi:hypothetical protein